MMTTINRDTKQSLSEKITYTEVLGANRVVYRVTSSKKMMKGTTFTTYGVEAEMKIGPVKFCEKIDDFSEDVNQATGFAELLVSNNIKPALIYNAALCYLRQSI